MHLIQRMKIWKELRRLEQRVREQPSPSTFVDLGQVYINLDLHDKALRLADDGLALFPKSPELRQLADCSRRGQRQKRLAELRTSLLRAPAADLYQELAKLQVEGGDSTGLHETCQEWSQRFPGDAGCWVVLGQARLVNFYRDLSAAEGREAVACLQRAVDMDPSAGAARRLLGEVLYRVGAVRASLAQLEELRRSSPQDAELATLLGHVRSLGDCGSDLQTLLDEVEAHGSLQHPSLATVQPAHGDAAMARVRQGLGLVAKLRGVHKATFIRGAKALVKGAIRDGRDPFLRVVRVAAKAAHRFSRRLDIGSANKTVIDGPFGHICICVYGEALAAAQCDTDADVGEVLAELQELVAGALHTAAEEGK